MKTKRPLPGSWVGGVCFLVLAVGIATGWEPRRWLLALVMGLTGLVLVVDAVVARLEAYIDRLERRRDGSG